MEGVRGEITVVLAGAEPRPTQPMEVLVERVGELVDDGARLKDAAGEVATAAGVSHKQLYDAVLAARKST